MAKRINTKLIRICIAAFALIAILLVAAVPLLSSRNRESVERDVAPAFAPVEYAYPEYFTDQELESGNSWRLNDQNMFVLNTDDGTFVVTPDGIVYRQNPDGSLTEVTDQTIIDEVLSGASEAVATSTLPEDFFTVDLPFTGSGIEELIDGRITEDEYYTLRELGFTDEEILELLDDGYTGEELINAAEEGIAAEDAAEYIDYQEEIRDRLEETLTGTGITVDELLQELEDYGLTPEEYLAGIEYMQNDSIGDDPATSPVPTSSGSLKASDLPALTINLGGNASSVVRKEEEYQEAVELGYQSPDISSIASALNTESSYTTQNDQQGKSDFMSSFSSNSGFEYMTTNDIAPGTVISMILRTGLNTDLPGQIMAEVTQNVYDSLTGSVLLIPKGTRLVASYSSSVTFGQQRVLIAWTQLIRPDGLILNLPGLPGIDAQGYMGYADKVNNHIWSLLGGTALASLISLAENEIASQAELVGDTIAEAMGIASDNVSSTAEKYIDRLIDRQPTITIRPGKSIKLLVTQKLTLDPMRF